MGRHRRNLPSAHPLPRRRPLNGFQLALELRKSILPSLSAWASEGEHMAHWWRYSDKVEANEHIIDELPPPDHLSDLGMHLRARDMNFRQTNESTEDCPTTLL